MASVENTRLCSESGLLDSIVSKNNVKMSEDFERGRKIHCTKQFKSWDIIIISQSSTIF